MDFAHTGLEFLRSKLNPAFDLSIKLSTQMASCPPYLLFRGEENFASFPLPCCLLLLNTECFPFCQRLLCGGMWKGGVAEEEALGSFCGEHQLCPNQWLFLTAVEVLLFVTLQLVSGSHPGTLKPAVYFSPIFLSLFPLFLSLSGPFLVSTVSSSGLVLEQPLLLCPVSGDCIRLCCC